MTKVVLAGIDVAAEELMNEGWTMTEVPGRGVLGIHGEFEPGCDGLE